MSTIKKILSFLLVLSLCCTLTACGSQSADSADASTPQPVVSQETPDVQSSVDSPAPSDESSEGSSILIVYFTYGENASLPDGVDAASSASIQYRGDTLTGNTGLVAGMIAEATGGELFSILTEEQYPDNYDDTLDAAQVEKGDNARPELTSHIDSLDNYDTVFLCYPNWWGDMPMAVYSFLDEYDLSGKTIVPLVISGGSGFSGTIRAIENAEPDAVVLEGLSISAGRSTQSESDVSDWLARLGLAG